MTYTFVLRNEGGSWKASCKSEDYPDVTAEAATEGELVTALRAIVTEAKGNCGQVWQSVVVPGKTSVIQMRFGGFVVAAAAPGGGGGGGGGAPAAAAAAEPEPEEEEEEEDVRRSYRSSESTTTMFSQNGVIARMLLLPLIMTMSWIRFHTRTHTHTHTHSCNRGVNHGNTYPGKTCECECVCLCVCMSLPFSTHIRWSSISSTKFEERARKV